MLVFQSGEYEDSTPKNSAWREGDWNCDSDFDSADMVLAFEFGSDEAAARWERNLIATAR